jgi:hypothetical protein
VFWFIGLFTARSPSPIDPGARQREENAGFGRKPSVRRSSPRSRRMRTSLNARWCLLRRLHAMGGFFNRRANLFLSPQAGAVSHPHDDVVGNRMPTTRLSAVPLRTSPRLVRSEWGRCLIACAHWPGGVGAAETRKFLRDHCADLWPQKRPAG